MRGPWHTEGCCAKNKQIIITIVKKGAGEEADESTDYQPVAGLMAVRSLPNVH